MCISSGSWCLILNIFCVHSLFLLLFAVRANFTELSNKNLLSNKKINIKMSSSLS